MERVNKIMKHDLFNRCLDEIETAEEGRKFCRHAMGHFLDVARLALILNLKERMGVEQELIYGAALLHDIGRHVQYAEGTPHEAASAEIAPEILKDCGFDEKETAVIIEAIAGHRRRESASEKNLTGLLYRADKLSRSCFACKAEPECDWKQEKKNRQLVL